MEGQLLFVETVLREKQMFLNQDDFHGFIPSQWKVKIELMRKNEDCSHALKTIAYGKGFLVCLSSRKML
jgi:hypothetical protein